MVMNGPESQMQNSAHLSPAAPVVAFDFDGTLTVHDSFRAFLRWRKGPMAFYLGLARLLPAVARYLANRDRGSLKAAMVRVYLAGLPRADLEREAAEFATVAAPRLFRPDALERWRRHRAEGARLVIVTASPDVLVWPFARALGADMLLGTRLTFDPRGRVSGVLEGANCRGAEKVRRLQAALGKELRLHAAYGDTAGDKEMLAIADQPFMRLFTGRSVRNSGAP
jgi:phosphatidylglycerophosphatase C